MGACCGYDADGNYHAFNAIPPACIDSYSQEHCNSFADGIGVFRTIWHENESCLDIISDPDHQGGGFIHGCPARLHACCLPRDCIITSEDQCESRYGGILNTSTSYCDPDPCYHACCLPDGTCNNSRVTWCRDMEGEIKWGRNCADDPCPEPPKPCCLCRGQCLMVPESLCSAIGGVTQEAWSNCETAAGRCITLDVQKKCKTARFAVTADVESQPDRYIPFSIDLMDPHEYERATAWNANCRTWRGSVSADEGAWSCGQWNINVGNTKRYFHLHVRIGEDVGGRGQFWTTYRPVCPEYN